MTIPPPDAAPRQNQPFSATAPAPLDGFPPEEFRARRDALRDACQDSILLIRGATEDEVAHSAAANFRQNPNFFYLTGVDTPGAFLVLLPDGVSPYSGLRDLAPDTREILFLPARDATTETWTGPKLGPGAEAEQATGIQRVVDAGGLWGALTAWLRRNPVLTTLAPFGEQAKRAPEFQMMQQIADRAPVAQFRDASEALANLRMVKSPAEIARIRQAVAVTVEGQKAAREIIAQGAGRWEYEVEAAVFAAFRSRGAHLAFPSIVGAGFNGTVLHYEDNHAQMQAGDLVVVDIGARVGHYHGDLTRTCAVGGELSPRQREIYALVREAHEHAVARFRPGADSLVTLNDRCKEFLKASSLRAQDSSGAEQTMEAFMPHRLGHPLGLSVHDVGDWEAPLPVGSVLTIEPGLYLPSESIGVRLEDNYLVTASGLERLGPPLEM